MIEPRDLLDWSYGFGPRVAPGELTATGVDRIPRLIHFVYGLWDTSPGLPWRCRASLGSWRRHHPDWSMVLWSRLDADHLVETAFPELQATYRGLARPVQRCDLLRYLLLLRFGGVYADLDLRCDAPLRPLLLGEPRARLIVLVERRLSGERAAEIGELEPIREGRPEARERIANYFLAASPGHPILAEVVALVRTRAHLPVVRDYDVLYTTGPDVVSEVLASHRDRPDVVVLEEGSAGTRLTHLERGAWRRAPAGGRRWSPERRT